jgi:hypothetical protein
MATVNNLIARVSNDGGTSVTTGTFDTNVGDLLVLCGNADENTGSATWTLTDNQGNLTYTLIVERGNTEAGQGACAGWYHANGSNRTGMTITLAVGGDGDSPSLKVYLVAGYDSVTPVGANNEGDLTTDPQDTTAITSQTDGGIFFANWTDWNQTGVPTSSDLTVAGFDTAGDISGGSGYKTISGVGTSVTGNINSGATPSGNWVSFEVRNAGAGPWLPQTSFVPTTRPAPFRPGLAR